MEHRISDLVAGYENGRLTRRQLIQGLALLVGTAASSESAAAAPAAYSLKTPTSVNHVQIMVSDLKRSREFYTTFLNLKPVGGVAESNKDDSKVALLEFADTQIVLRPATASRPVGTVNHFAFGFDNFNAEKILADLKAAGFKAELDPVPPIWPSINVPDPDGLRLQLVDKKGKL